MEETCLLSMWCPVYRGRDSNPGFRMERENLAGDAKGKDPSGKNTRSKVPMRGPGADSSVVVMKWGNAHGAKGGGHPHRDWWANGRPEELTGVGGRRQPFGVARAV